MGNSKVILLGGFCIALGFFSSVILEADRTSFDTGVTQAYYSQAEQIAMTGVDIAAYYLSTPNWLDGLSMTNRSMLGGTLTYRVEGLGISSKVQVISTGIVNGKIVTATAVLERGTSGATWATRYYSHWKVTKVFMATS
jgi:hypothetical protein